MRILLAGASGAVGVPLTRRLLGAGHEVIGLARSSAGRDRIRSLGATAVVADVLDRANLLDAVGDLTADVVIHQLTALKKTPMRHRDMALTNRLRIEGTAHLLDAARAVGAGRFVTQSMILGYGYGDWGHKVLTENDEFAPPGRGAFEAPLAAMRSNEEQVRGAARIEGIALRYGAFYGPGAGMEMMVSMLRRRQFPVTRTGVTSLIHVDDAADATVAALEHGRPGGAYNIVDDEPTTWLDFLTEVASAFRTPRPMVVPGWLLRPMPYAHAMLAGGYRVSNAKAKDELGWQPSMPTYRDGIRASEAPYPR